MSHASPSPAPQPQKRSEHSTLPMHTRFCQTPYMLILAAALASPMVATSEEISPPPEHGERTQQNRERDTWGLPVSIISEPEVTAEERAEQEQAIQREIDDLAAQQGMERATVSIDRATQDMRDYARSSLVLSWISLFVGTGSTILLLLTLRQTRQANKISTIASNAAVDSVKVAQSIGITQNRPYLGLSEAQIVQTDGSGRSFSVAFKVKNYGTTPARQVRWCAEHNLAFNLPKITKDEADLIKETQRMADVNPSQEILLSSRIPDECLLAWIDAKKVSGVFQYHYFGYIDYVDLFGRRRRQYFGCFSKSGVSFHAMELLLNPEFNFDVDLER